MLQLDNGKQLKSSHRLVSMSIMTAIWFILVRLTDFTLQVSTWTANEFLTYLSSSPHIAQSASLSMHTSTKARKKKFIILIRGPAKGPFVHRAICFRFFVPILLILTDLTMTMTRDYDTTTNYQLPLCSIDLLRLLVSIFSVLN